jgi:phosphoribosylformimino-5-aminoimidazole carboxamide ribotide isomerase
MTRFRPCIDLHEGRVKQIVGSSLSGDGKGLKTNFVSEHSAEWFARRYAQDGLVGGHVIQLGAGNQQAAKSALSAYPGGLQIGGGIRLENALEYLDAGASHVIVTSFLFDHEGRFLSERLQAMARLVGPERLVVDLSCRALEGDGGWVVAMDRWQKRTDLLLSPENLREIGGQCAEFLVHAVDVEGKCEGIDERLVVFLGQNSPIPVTYAGGVHRLEVLHRIEDLSKGRVDATIGSALDLFGGTAVSYQDCLAFNARKG